MQRKALSARGRSRRLIRFWTSKWQNGRQHGIKYWIPQESRKSPIGLARNWIHQEPSSARPEATQTGAHASKSCSQSGRQIAGALEKFNIAEDQFRGRLFERDSYPVWSKGAYQENAQAMGYTYGSPRTGITQRPRNFWKPRLWVHHLSDCSFYALALTFSMRLKRYVESGDRPGIPPGAREIFQRPYSVALLLSLDDNDWPGIGGSDQRQRCTLSSVDISHHPTASSVNQAQRLHPLLYTLVGSNMLGGIRVWILLFPTSQTVFLALGLIRRTCWQSVG